MAVKKIAQKKAKAVTAASPRAKFNTDFIPTISDSESDVPDLDSDDEEIKKSAEVSAVKTVKSKKVKKDRKNKQNAKSKGTETAESDEDSGQNQTSKDLNPDFIFSVEDLGSTATFDGWDFEINAKDSTDIKKKDVDLDEIIRRKGGLSGKVNINAETEDTNDASDDDRSNSFEAEFDESNEESNEESDDDVNLEEEQVKLDDDELALDGFGMGAESAKKIEEHGSKEDGDINHVNDVKSDDGGDDDDDDIIDEEGTTDYETIPDQSSDENGEDDADSAEAIASYYDQEEGDAAKEQTHKTFQSLQLSRPILKSLASLNYSKPTPIQSASIPIALLGRDIVAGAMTGSGKTAAYIIPIIERLLYKPAKIAKTRVIILTPTRELAIQVADVGRKLGQYVHNLTFGLAVGGLNLRQQEQELKKRPDVVIATPGRLIDHIRNSPSFSVDDVEIVIMDEADRMLEEGFEKEMQEIVELLPRKRQTMLFSATMNSSIKQLIQWSLEKPVRIMIDPPKTAASGLVQEFVRVRKREELKPALLFSVLSKLDQNQRIIVFVSTKDMCHKLRIRLGLLGLRVGELHGGLTQDQRLVSVTLFKKSTVPILLCTDLAARGLDIPKIEVVINFDMPKTHEIYLHRVGRTARAGRDGISISFVGEAKRERAIVREVIKNVEESGNGKAMGRNADWAEVERVNNVLVSKADIIDEIIEEEKQEKQVLAAEMELTKGENLIKYREEIESRPKRTWFMSEKEKKEDKNRVIDALSKTKKLTNSKKRKRAEALADSGNHLRTYTKTGKDRSENDIKRITKSSAKKNGKDKKIGKGKFGKRLRK